MRIEPTRILNSYRNANAYLIPTGKKGGMILIDAGGPDITEYIKIIGGKTLLAILLTHEHSDHCLLVDDLASKYNCRVYGSKACSVNAKSSKHNFSQYIEEIPTFSVSTTIDILEDSAIFEINGLEVTCIETPGHCPGSICFKVEDCIFTGDTILNNIKSPTNFPHSNKKQYIDSINYLLEHIEYGDRVFPGHGSCFPFFSKRELLESIGFD